MKLVIEYPVFECTQTYIGATPEEIDIIRDETEEHMRTKYGIGWDAGMKVILDETSPIQMEIEKEIEDAEKLYR